MFKKDQKVSYKKEKGVVEAFYKNPDGTYTLNIRGRIDGFTCSWTHLSEEEVKKIKVL